VRSVTQARRRRPRLAVSLDDDGTTDAIDRAIAGLPPDHAFSDAAASALASGDAQE
jgi:hypothetical protein